MRDSIGISEEQMKELRTSFNHFDKNSNNQLDVKEFKQCLVSLGHSVDIEEKVRVFTPSSKSKKINILLPCHNVSQAVCHCQTMIFD